MRTYLLFLVLSSSFTSSQETTSSHVMPTSENDCKKIAAVAQVISETIAVGAPTYNQGNHIGCYRVYEGAAYKICTSTDQKCKDVKNTLEDALEKSYGDYSA